MKDNAFKEGNLEMKGRLNQRHFYTRVEKLTSDVDFNVLKRDFSTRFRSCNPR